MPPPKRKKQSTAHTNTERALGLYDAGQTPRPVDLHHGDQRLLEAPPPPDERCAGVVPPARRETPQRLGHGVVVHVDLVRVRVRIKS